MPVRSDSDDVRGESSKGPSTSRAGRQAVELDFLDSPNPGSKRGMTVEDVNRWIKTMSQWRKDIREIEKYPKGHPNRPLQELRKLAAGEIERNTQALIKTNWKEVVTKRRGNDKTKRKGETLDGNSRKQQYLREPTKETRKGKERSSGRKPPKSAAVAISGTNEEFSYADVLRKAREKIDLKALKIDNSRIRPSANGGVLNEIPGKEGNSKADALIEKLRETFDSEIANKKVHFSRPIVKGDIRVTGIDVSIWEEDIRDSILDYGDCAADNIRVSRIQRMRNGIGVAWVVSPGYGDQDLRVGRPQGRMDDNPGRVA
ncbi:hypothetical protein RF55_11564 [Lasius niger]|uniref:Uncharacterized protein n=1 Tax=Lasius niger TaxID=67767 RepID=A0A0J7KF48_LASNI|nr:hypothetical protein RF55_11564 [Lasius niger]